MPPVAAPADALGAADTTGGTVPQPPPGEAADAGSSAPPAPAQAGALSDEAPKRRERTHQAICTRTCNKSQICGVGGDSVADCYARCTNFLEAEGTPEGRPVAAGVRAKESCADGPCTAFKDCADLAAPREYAYLAAPPISPKAARERCGPICDAEKQCSTAPETPLPPGEDTCTSTCELVMVSIDLRVAQERQRLQAVLDCKDSACDAREACITGKMSPPSPAAEPGAAP